VIDNSNYRKNLRSNCIKLNSPCKANRSGAASADRPYIEPLCVESRLKRILDAVYEMQFDGMVLDLDNAIELAKDLSKSVDP
jgi:hypothetical protein